MISLLHPALVDECREGIERLLYRVLRKNGYTVDAVIESLKSMNSIGWVFGEFEGIVVAKIIQRPSERVLWIEWLAGDGSWLPDWEEVQNQFAKEAGCSAVEFSGRPGWKKYEGAFPDYKVTAIVRRKELNG